MNPFFTSRKKFLLFFSVLIASLESNSTETPAILREWAAYSGISDSTFKTPVLTENDYTYVATVEENTVSGADIVVVKYNNNGIASWKQPWTGAGFGRDQAADMVMDSLYLYICGTTYSSATNFDFLIIKMQKANGAIEWTRTYNGTANNYDIATAIAINDSSIYVTGVTSSLNTLLDYHTLKYHINGNLLWSVNFDYNNLLDIPFAISYSQEDSNIIVTGGSQSSIYDWDYQTNIYKYNGTTVDLGRVSGTSVGFDRATAVKTDSLGNIYITGATRENNSNFDIKTVKLDKLGNLIWQRTFDNNGGNDIANDLVVNNDGEIYLVGTIEGNGSDYLVMRLDASNGGIVWQNTIDCGANDTARAICFDSHGNIVITGQAFNPENSNYDFLTINFDRAGQELWRDYFDGPDHGDDNATNIASDNDGNIFVTGQTWVGNDFHTVTIKYKTDFFTQPPAVDTPSVAYLFYPNSGQLVNTDDSLVTDSVHYYTLHHSPQLYFGYGMMNMVWSHVDDDTATADTLQRVDVTFANSTNPTEAYPIDEDTSSYLNYFLGHCPNGITNVHGSTGLLFTDVYPDIDVLYSSNNAGLKLLFIINPGASIPQEMGLAFAGDNGISVLNNWGLNVHTSLGDYEFEKPHVYQIDTSGNRIALPWHLNWNVVQSGEAGFTGWGSYDGGIPLIIEIAKNIQNQILHLSGVEWATPVGGFDNDVLTSCTNDPNGNFFVTGYSNSSQFPITPGQIIYSNQIDVLTAKFGGPIYPFPNPDTDRLMWTTFFGGPGDDKGFSIATKPYNANSTYNVYIVGETSSDIAIFNNGNSSSYNQANNNGNKDAFLLRLDNNSGGAVSGSRWSTLIGGTNDDIAKVVKIDVSENIYIGGQTKSNATTSLCQDPTDNNFPLCHSQTSGIFDNTNNGNGDGFLMIFNSNEDLLLSTFYGGDGDDIINGITIDNNGKVYFCGNTSNSTNFPLQTQGIYNQTFFGGGGFDGFITKLNTDFSYAWSMLYGGSDEDNFNCMDHDSQNNIYIVGRTKSNQPASTNGGTSPCPTVSHNCQVPPIGEYPMYDPGGEVFFQKETNCNNGHHNGDFDGTITEFNEDGELKWSTYYGGNLEDNISGIAINNNDAVFIVGTTHSQLNFPYQTHGGAYLDSHLPPATGSYNGFLGELDSDLNHYHKNIWTSSYNSYDNLSQYIPFNEEINAISVYGEYWFIAGSTEDAGTNLEEHICCPMAYQQGSVFGKDGIVARFWESGMWMPWVTEVHKNFGNLIIYPNPAINKIKINLSFIKLTPYSIIIYNSSGKICYSESKNLKVVKDLQEISCENFSNGLYYLQVLTEEGNISSKFIINR